MAAGSVRAHSSSCPKPWPDAALLDVNSRGPRDARRAGVPGPKHPFRCGDRLRSFGARGGSAPSRPRGFASRLIAAQSTKYSLSCSIQIVKTLIFGPILLRQPVPGHAVARSSDLSRSDPEVTVSTSRWPRDQVVIRVCWCRSGQSRGPRSIDKCLDQAGLGRGQQLRDDLEIVAAGDCESERSSISMPITWPLGASRTCPWQASSTPQTSCS